ncbi:hypothetical protein MKW98_026957 [Papaver atlanticum]|uniref:Uncharacterized protein n=1 Tax=Papaver atlanticum TaxID=357466 RepID=A0AAD4XM10_9MAGN|nr:hypothetical protein MKW98_026957 [Papaver atlanticum]
MDSNRKRIGFIKGRIISSLYKALPKPTSVGIYVLKYFFFPQASSNKKVAFLTTDNILPFNYISYVQERFQLEQIDSERRKYKFKRADFYHRYLVLYTC